MRTETESRCTEAVRPAALDPLPDVYTAMGATWKQCEQSAGVPKERQQYLLDELEQLTLRSAGVSQ